MNWEVFFQTLVFTSLGMVCTASVALILKGFFYSEWLVVAVGAIGLVLGMATMAGLSS